MSVHTKAIGARWVVLFVSDTAPGPHTIGMPGLTRSWDFHWNQDLGKHILNGRAYDLDNPQDVEEFNAACVDCCRCQHKWCFPVPMIIPVAVAHRMPYFSKGTPRPARLVDPAVSLDREGPLVSATARRLALEHKIDVGTLKGTGQGNSICAADVRAAIAGAAQDQEGQPQAPGNISVDELNRTLEVA